LQHEIKTDTIFTKDIREESLLRIGVVGGGAIGLLSAGYLSKVFPVTLYVRRKEQKNALLEKGLTIENGPKHIRDISIKLSGETWTEEVMILSVKQPDLPDVLKEHSEAAIPGQSLVFLQNGASHLDFIDHLNYDHLFVGLVEHGALKSSDTTVVHKGKGQIKIGGVRGDKRIIEPLVSNRAFPMTFVDDWQRALDEKLLINAVINPLTSIYKVKNGALTANPHYLKIARTVFEEALTVLDFDDKEARWEHVLQVCQNTSENRSSMLQDIEAGRLTEVDAILGILLSRAKKKSIHLPVIQFLYESIKGLESTR